VPKSQDIWNSVAPGIEFSLPACIPELATLIGCESRVVEIGCGYGRICRELADHGFVDVTGYDRSPAMIERGNLEFPDLALRHCSEARLPEHDCSVDAVVCCALLTCIPNPAERRFVMLECHRLLRPGGILHLIEITRNESRIYESNGSFQSGLGIQMIHLSMDQLSDEMGDFQTITMKGIECRSISGRAENAIFYQGKKPVG
jgi:SAM-dependent methyltransferase